MIWFIPKNFLRFGLKLINLPPVLNSINEPGGDPEKSGGGYKP
jgi:hypothetical protein